MKAGKTNHIKIPSTKFGSLFTAVLILILSSVFLNDLSAQPIDSLQNILNSNSIKDTTRVRLMAKLAHSYRDANLDSMMAISRRGVFLAERIKFDNGKAACIKELGTSYSAKNMYDTTLAYYKQALKIFEETHELIGQRETIQSMANIYGRQLKYGLAIEYHQKSMELSLQLNDKNSVGLTLVKIGTNYSELGNYSESIRYYLDASKIYEKEKNNTGILMCLTSIANVYSLLNNYKKAEEYVNKSLALQDGRGDKHDLISFYVDVGAVYTGIKKYNNGLIFFNKAFRLADSIGDDYWKNVSLADLAETYYNMGNLDSAIVKYRACITNLEATNDEYVTTVAYTGIGKVLVKKGQAKEGIPFLLRSYDIAQKNALRDVIFENAEELSKAYELIKDYEKALAFRKVYEDNKDSLFNEKSERHIQQLQFDYQLEKNKTIAHNKSERQTTIILSMMAGLALFVAIIVLLYKSRQHEKNNKEKSIAFANEIKQQALKLEELNSFKDKTFSVLSHDLRGPISGFTSTMAMLDQKEITQEEFNEIRPEINKQLDSLNLLLENLLGWSKNHMQGEASVKPEQLNLSSIVAGNITLFENTVSKKNISIHNNIPTDLSAYADKGQVDIIFRNLLNNAIKFTSPDGTIVLTGKTTGNNTIVSIADTGVGMTANQIKNIFGIAPDKSTYGTEGEKGIGIGLLLCYEFVKVNNGDITVTSKPGEGTTFNVILPSG